MKIKERRREMRLRNKKTGDVFNFTIKATQDNTACYFILKTGSGGWEDGLTYGTLEELNEEWEDYNELEYWYIDNNGDILFSDLDDDKLWKDLAEERNEIGNYFETKEEAEKAVEKLKAIKRLKDKGFRFESWFGGSKLISFRIGEWADEDIAKDLDLLFGGEE